MQKFNGGNPVHICDECKTMFYPGDTIVELCKECTGSVWAVFSVYDINGNYIKELNCIFRTEEKAKNWVEKHKAILDAYNLCVENKILDVKYEHWSIL